MTRRQVAKGEVNCVSSEYWKQAWAVLNGSQPGNIAEASADASHVLLKVSPQDFAEPATASNAVVTHAPMGDYDVVEVAIFDQPAARIRWVADAEEGAGMIGSVKALPGKHFDADTDGAEDARRQLDAVVQQLRFAAADEAWNAGADELFTVVKAGEKDALVEDGWEVVAEVTVS